jgi:hypothetical protein
MKLLVAEVKKRKRVASIVTRAMLKEIGQWCEES